MIHSPALALKSPVTLARFELFLNVFRSEASLRVTQAFAPERLNRLVL
jgi:hypothetical protein